VSPEPAVDTVMKSWMRCVETSEPLTNLILRQPVLMTAGTIAKVLQEAELDQVMCSISFFLLAQNP
jgi:hypothetical protein